MVVLSKTYEREIILNTVGSLEIVKNTILFCSDESIVVRGSSSFEQCCTLVYASINAAVLEAMNDNLVSNMQTTIVQVLIFISKCKADRVQLQRYFVRLHASGRKPHLLGPVSVHS